MPTVSTSSISASESSDSSVVNGASDITQLLYDRYQAGEELDQLVLKAVPEAVETRLNNLSLKFEDLPGLMQRAVLWDTGFVVTSDNQAVQMWTLDDRAVADIAVSADEFEAAGCEALSCTPSNGSVVQMYSTCSKGPIQMLAASKCVVEAFASDGSSNATMWSTAGDSSLVRDIQVVKQAGRTECGCDYTIYSIHTTTSADQFSTTGECPVGDWSGSLVIPCYSNDSIPDSAKSRTTTPNGTEWVTRWIRGHGNSSTSGSSESHGSASATTEAAKDDGGGFSLWWLLLILLIILLLIIATIVACRHCHRLSRFTSPPDNTTYIFVGGRMWAVEEENNSRGAGYWFRFANCGSSSSNDNKSYNMGLLVPIIGISILLLLGGVCCCWMRRKWRKSGRKRDANVYENRTVMISFSHLGGSSEMSDVVSSRTIQSAQSSGEDTYHVSRIPPREAYELGSDSGPNYIWRILNEDRHLTRKRIPYKEIKLRARIFKGQTREIRLGEYQNRQIVVKRLLKAKRAHIFHVQEFIYQIQIRSKLAHPNIATLVGVAWNSVVDVMLVMEHYPSGDLLTYLQNYGEYISWERGKYRLAIGVARALVYLHSQPTPVAHRDLRASNVLLTETLKAKLTGFDSSCLDQDSHRCHVAGAPFWSAPEVLRGRPYTAKSDIYAFGVLLTELDTTNVPFHDALSPIGTKLKPIQILNERIVHDEFALLALVVINMILVDAQQLSNCYGYLRRNTKLIDV
ncbi:Protein kinase [Phytophthora megakarya]|uniref:Protein kinase n=1 Tax=Phytophthora megakarya TaxID=4795 RepID=A0A225X4P5_9STRA|nr:Protein kinase [Phytophthora megakarya]